MSIGNLKDSGNQGNNMPFQWKVLQGLQEIANQTALPLTCVEDSVTICGPAGGLDVNLHDGAGTAITSTTIGADTGVDVNIIGSVTLDVTITEANDSILVYGNDGTTNRKIKTDANGELQVDVLTMPATFVEDTAHASGNTGAFVLGVRNDSNTAMTSANGDYSPIAVNSAGAIAIQDGGNSITVDGGTGVSRTPTILRTSASSSIAAGAYSMSFASVGTVNATVGGATLKPGETINFDAGAINNTLGSVAYNSSAVGAELLIITLT
jgi:hypothetical protein